VLKVRDTWSRTAEVYAHRADGWPADVTTRRDLDHFAAATVRIDQLRTEQARDLRGYGLALITVNATITALAVGLSQAL
jgi:hypothetical protein